ncbi:hypothetical protein [Cellulomonas sp.]|uniref:hypothetical protein n=1 Tax=Cellulomonas sp. TaxID=40001 RepID=UPI003BA8D59B
MASADYTRLAQYLPAVYQDDASSFAQVDAFLGLADELNHAYLERLDDLSLVLGPDAALRWPTDLPLDAGRDALVDAYLSAYDEVATWAAFAFPASWGLDEAGVAQRRTFLAKAARIWRRRGTPRGFLDWFCLAFGIAADARPYLLEHFKVPGPQIVDPELTGTLFVPSTSQFSDYRRRHEAAEFVDWYAPAHVLLRVCWTRPDFTVPDPPVLPAEPTPEQVAAFQAAVDLYRADLRALLCSITSFIDHANGIRIWECIDEGRSIDRLDVGHLPSED